MGIKLVDVLLPLRLVASLVRSPVFQRVNSVLRLPRIGTVSKIDGKIR